MYYKMYVVILKYIINMKNYNDKKKYFSKHIVLKIMTYNNEKNISKSLTLFNGIRWGDSVNR